MSVLRNVPLHKLTPARLWVEMDQETRRLAARLIYRPDWDDTGARAEADAAIAAALRFRQQAVRRLPVDKRVDYLTRAVRPGETLAAALLRALHLGERSAMLAAFLDSLGIPQKDGVIEGDDDDLLPPEAEALTRAVATLRESYPDDDVDLYVASLLAMEPDFWEGLSGLVQNDD